MARIVIVEDDEILAEVMSEELAACGHSVSVEWHGDLAIAAIRASEPDLVILDYGLPGRTGMSILRDLRSFFHASLLIMMVTARAGRIHIGRAAAEGADDYVVKPFEAGEVLRRVETLLVGASMLRSVETTATCFEES